MEEKRDLGKLTFSAWIAPNHWSPFEWLLPTELYFLYMVQYFTFLFSPRQQLSSKFVFFYVHVGRRMCKYLILYMSSFILGFQCNIFSWSICKCSERICLHGQKGLCGIFSVACLSDTMSQSLGGFRPSMHAGFGGCFSKAVACMGPHYMRVSLLTSWHIFLINI